MLVSIALTLVACSATVVNLAEAMDESDLDPTRYRLAEAITIEAPRTADLKLRADTQWSHIGTISHGRVFDTKDQVIIVNSFNVYEAAIVVKDGNIVGYYPKVAKAFVATRPVPLEFVKVE
ncbi:MAG: hypothetical protein QNI98_05245 [Woeseiaceae bacterium]|nr:hypothetical protein [Woeseiaceae bacterium]